jgi:hypothetical protein
VRFVHDGSPLAAKNARRRKRTPDFLQKIAKETKVELLGTWCVEIIRVVIVLALFLLWRYRATLRGW